MDPWRERTTAVRAGTLIAAATALFLVSAVIIDPLRLAFGVIALIGPTALVLVSRRVMRRGTSNPKAWTWALWAGATLFPTVALATAVLPQEGIGALAFLSLLHCVAVPIGVRRSARLRAAREIPLVKVPAADAPILAILQFGRTTYRGEDRHKPNELAWIASRTRSHWDATHKAPDSGQVARAALYYEAKRKAVDDEAYVRALVDRIRRSVAEGMLIPDHDGVGMKMRRAIGKPDGPAR